jgi:2-dehydro-3-deoxygluconokinase
LINNDFAFMGLNTQSKMAAFGELMMRLNSPYGKRLTDPGSFDVLFGGAEANVCVFLAGLGYATRFITRLPENDLGSAAIDRLRSHGIDLSSIDSGTGRMGLYFTENGYLIRPSRVLYDRKESAFSTLSKGMIDWTKAFEGVEWFHWSGISPAVSASVANVCLEALEHAKQMGVRVSVDLNYRSSLWDYGVSPSLVMPELISYCDLAVGDLHAASIYFDIDLQKNLSVADQFRQCAEQMQSKFNSLKTIAFSFRNNDEQHREHYFGAMMHYNQYYFSSVNIIPQVVDRIGTGDAFCAGLIYSILNKFKEQDIIEFAVACGILKHSIYGDFARISNKEVNEFIKLGPGNRVIR